MSLYISVFRESRYQVIRLCMLYVPEKVRAWNLQKWPTQVIQRPHSVARPNTILQRWQYGILNDDVHKNPYAVDIPYMNV